MNIFVIQANPVGTATDLLDGKVLSLKAQWDLESKPQVKWWQFFNKERLMAAVSFFLNCIDQLILHINEFDLTGKDKKATVLAAAAIIYDYVVSQAMPIFLKPFSGQIKNILIYVALSYMIDFMVEKYRTGLWKGDQNAQNPIEVPTSP